MLLYYKYFIFSGPPPPPPDNRCYLENGASAESFFVPEDLPVGTTIGANKNVKLFLKYLYS